MRIKLIAATVAAFAITVARADVTYSNSSATETGALAQSCTQSTVFVPVIQNVTVTEMVLYSAPSTSPTTVVRTTVAATTTITAGWSVSEAVVSSSSGPPYTFSVVDSSTLWAGGAFPTNGGQLSIATSIVTLSPVDSFTADLTTWMTLTSTSTMEKFTTITLPATTLSTYSILSTILTTTLTSTHYKTYTLSEMPSRSAFSGVSSAGWNASTIQATQSAPVLPAVTTLTQTHYYGLGNITTSTSTNRVTTTLEAIITTTLLPPATVVTVNAPGAPLSFTTVTAAPITVTYTVQSEPSAFRTSLSFSSIQTDTAVGAAEATSSDENVTTSTIPVSSEAQPGLPPTYTALSFLSPSANVSTSYVGSTNPSLPTISSLPATSGISAATPNVSTGDSVTAGSSASGLTPQSTVPTILTVTSLVSGSGTTLTLTFSPVLATSTSGLATLSSTINSVRVSSSGLLTSPATTAIVSSVPGSSAAGSATAKPTQTSNIASRPSISNFQSALLSESDLMTESSFTRSMSSIGSPRVGSTLSQSPTRPTSVSSQATSTSKTSSISSAALSISNSVSAPTSTSSSPSRNDTASVSASRTTSAGLSDSFPASSASSTPTRGCGEQGNFTMTFDDLPTFHPGQSANREHRRQSNGTSDFDNDITRQPPLDLRPYHHLIFSNGFVYAPRLVEPFAPISQPNVAAFLPDGAGVRTGGRPADMGEIGDGPGPDDVSALWFDAFTAFLGCDNAGPGVCTMEVTGLHWDPVAKDETPAFSQNYTLPPCLGYRNCALTPITFPSTARSLSGLEIRALRNGKPRMFFMDNMHLAWSNKTCDAGMFRQQTH